MIIISAMSGQRVIGSGEGMPWNVPDEYRRYLNTVRHHTVILGRRSWEIFGKDLGDSNVIVVTRQPQIANVRTAASLEQALIMASHFDGSVFVAGGASIYEQAIPLADEMYLSTIKGNFRGDAYFPKFDSADWEVARQEEYSEYVFRRYVRPAARRGG